MRVHFDEQLRLLSDEMIHMGDLCQEMITGSAEALINGDIALAKKVPDMVEELSRQEREIESLCMKLLLHQQPVARDLRTISSALKMVTDMERVGHQAADIAEIITMANFTAGDDTLNIREMAQAVSQMVSGSIDAFVKQNIKTARQVIAFDDTVDRHFDNIKTVLINMLTESGADGQYVLDLLMIAKYFERIGDHAVNIAKWVVFSITGSREE